MITVVLVAAALAVLTLPVIGTWVAISNLKARLHNVHAVNAETARIRENQR